MKSTLFLTLGSLIATSITATPSPELAASSATSASLESRTTPNLPFGTNPISFFDLATSFPPPVIQDASSIEAIRNTIALYAFAIDGQNFPALSQVFTTNVVANYGPPLNILTGLSAIQSTIGASLTCVVTQHAYGTQLIQIRSLTTAFSVTYYRAVHYGKNLLKNEFLEALGQYQDTWQRQSDGKWKIVYRNLVYMGAITGNPAVFTDC